MKLSTLQMIAIVCILAVGFISVAPLFLQDAYAGVWAYDREGHNVYSFATDEFLRFDVVYKEIQYNNHYTYYHYPGNTTTAWEHAQSYPLPEGHPIYNLDYNLGDKWE